jgi:hypothetical protein
MEANFVTIQGKQLYHPRILDPQNVQNFKRFEEYKARKFRHQEPMQLHNGRWYIVYFHKDYDNANKLLGAMHEVSGQFGIKIGDPEWIEVGSFYSSDFKNAIRGSISDPKETQIVVVIIPFTRN